MDKKIFKTLNSEQTRTMGETLAREISRIPKESLGEAFLICLEGDLGSGKTTFVQGFSKGLGIKQIVNSPTFVIQKRFEIPKDKKFKNLFHIDCYRLEKPEDILALGWKEIMKDNKNVIIIEWPKKIKEFLPKEFLSITFKFISENTREISLN